jgi:hypothetical protein
VDWHTEKSATVRRGTGITYQCAQVEVVTTGSGAATGTAMAREFRRITNAPSPRSESRRPDRDLAGSGGALAGNGDDKEERNTEGDHLKKKV